MNIAHFTFEYPPSTTGGLGSYMESLVSYQKKLGDRIDVFFLDSCKPPSGTISLPFYLNGTLIYYNQKQLRELCNAGKYDAVICHDWAGALVSQPFYKQFIPLITTCHLPLSWDIGYYPDLPCDYADRLEFFAMAQSDLVIAVSNSVKQFLNRIYPFTQTKTEVVHNGIDTGFFQPGKKASQPILLYVGRFVEQKGFDLLPDIFALLKNSHTDLLFKIIGTGPLKSEIIKKLQDLNLLSSIKVYDFSDQQMVLELYREAAVVVIPSRHEPFGLVAAESMATETPVVASDVGGLGEIISDMEDSFLVPANDVKGFAEKISHVLSNKSLAKEVGQKARAKVLKYFDKEIGFKKTRTLYLDLINKIKEKVEQDLTAGT